MPRKSERQNSALLPAETGLINRNWVLAEALRVKLKLPHSSFYWNLKKESWRSAMIGKKCYIYKPDCQREDEEKKDHDLLYHRLVSLAHS